MRLIYLIFFNKLDQKDFDSVFGCDQIHSIAAWNASCGLYKRKPAVLQLAVGPQGPHFCLSENPDMDPEDLEVHNRLFYS